MLSHLKKKEIVNLAIEIVLKVVLLSLVFYYAFSIISPFVVLVAWGVIIAIALSPIITKLDKSLPLKRSAIVIILTVLSVSAILLPTYFLSESVITSSRELAQNLQNGNLNIPAPTENVKSWPLIGEKTYIIWSKATHNLQETLFQFKPQIQKYAGTIASFIGSSFLGILQFIASLIIAALFLVNSESSIAFANKIAHKIAGERGNEWANLSALTVRSVVQGVIGIALIQAVFSFIGLWIMEVPFAWLWAFVVMFLAIIQLPPWLILGPIIAYVFSYAESTPATIFAVYSIIISISDGFLKPFLLGRGVDIPMLVILLGAIGGMILSGILGLFVGAVGLAIAYKLFTAWLEEDEVVAAETIEQV